jgi:diguanylate cyclase (GGDEF)-like protein
MTPSTGILPPGALTRWLVDAGPDVPPTIRFALFSSLYATPAVFFAGILNALLVAGALATRHPNMLFIGWALAELALAAIRLPVMIIGRRAVREGRPGPSDLYIFLNLAWTASIGFGGFIALLTGDWVAATLACVSAAAMVGGICFRNFGAPRLAVAMILLSLGPCTVAGFATGEPIMLVALVQLPLYMFAMSRAAFNLHRMLVARMKAELDKDHRVRHDDLTGLYNRAGLAAALAHRDGAAADQAYFFLDLDGFKQVNDTLGHAAGDQLLAEVGERLRTIAPPGSVLSRMGGDEFLIVADCSDRDEARATAERVIAALAERAYLVGGGAVEIGVSVGIALSRVFGRDFATLIEAADGALYQAKGQGRSRWAIAGRQPRLAVREAESRAAA